MNGANLVAAAIDRASATVAGGQGSNLLTWSNLTLSLASVTAAVLSTYIARKALSVSLDQSDAARKSLEVSSLAIEEQLRSERLSRNLETLLHCQEAYKAVEAERLRYRYADEEMKQAITAGQAASFFRNYWTLKSDQLDYWLSGYVDYDTFLTWNVSTLRHFIKSREDTFFVKPFLFGWAHYGRPYHVEMNPLFVRFTDAIQYHFRSRTEVEDGDVFVVLNMIDELDRANLQIGLNGRMVRKFGAPESLDRYRNDLREMHSNMRGLLATYLPHNYDMNDYGLHLKRNSPT